MTTTTATSPAVSPLTSVHKAGATLLSPPPKGPPRDPLTPRSAHASSGLRGSPLSSEADPSGNGNGEEDLSAWTTGRERREAAGRRRSRQHLRLSSISSLSDPHMRGPAAAAAAAGASSSSPSVPPGHPPGAGAVPGAVPGAVLGSPLLHHHHHHHHHHHQTLLETTKADVLPVLSPVAASQQATPDRPYQPGQPKSLAGIAARAWLLGNALAACAIALAALLAATSSPLWRLPFFGAALALFHFLEFWTTAAYNTPAATVGSFLLTANWPAYAVAHAAAALECLVTCLVFPRRAWAPPHTGPLLLLAGLALVAAGQTVRSAAMAQAGASFNHTVQRRRAPTHLLVTTGIYASLRHPSYFGFFWWALGTQLVLGNVVCFVAYALVLRHFFAHRIRGEEELLVSFFGDEYEDYRRKVGTKIPFC